MSNLNFNATPTTSKSDFHFVNALIPLAHSVNPKDERYQDNAIVRGTFGIGRIVASKSVNGTIGYSVVMLYQTASGKLVTPDHPTRLWKWEGEIS